MPFRNTLYVVMTLTLSSGLSHAAGYYAGQAANNSAIEAARAREAAEAKRRAEAQAKADQAKRDAEWRRIQAQNAAEQARIRQNWQKK